jgi:hypothetical protein
MVTAGLPNLPAESPDFQRMLSPAKTSAALPARPHGPQVRWHDTEPARDAGCNVTRQLALEAARKLG